MAHDIVIPKKYRYFESKRFLTFFQVVAMGADRWFKSQYFEDEGIEVVENNPDEILALAQEMNARLDGTWKPHDEDEELQKAFWELFPPGHPVKGSPVRIGAEFLRQNQELLEM
jgi:putative glycosyltransferase (TIGR04372 family)